MATQTITYTNKVDLNTDSSIAAINKVVAADMNEIKNVVNNNANELDNLVIPEIKTSQSSSETDAYSCEFVNEQLNSKVDTGTVLYDNSSGESGNILLSDYAYNYSYLMVYWKSSWNSSRNGVAIAPIGTSNWSLFETVVGYGSDNATYENIAIYNISGTSFNLNKAKSYNGGTSNTFYITKIVGYK